MSDEMKTEEKECKCFCRSEGVKKFVVVALGTFVGVYCALSLFVAMHRPPQMHRGPHMYPPIGHRHDFRGPQTGDFRVQKPMKPEARTPFEAARPATK